MSRYTRILSVLVLSTAFTVAPALLLKMNTASFAQGNSGERGGNGNAGGNGNGGGIGANNGGGNGNAGGNGASNAGGNGNGNSGSLGAVGHSATRGNANASGQGAMASMLQGLNAYRANPNAASSAAPNSQVGRIAAYVNASSETQAAYQEWTRAYNEYLAFRDSYDGLSRNEIEAQIAALDTEAETYDAELASLREQLAALDAHEDETSNLAQISNTFAETYERLGQAEDDALEAAAGGRALSAEEEQQLRDLLGL